MKRSSLVFIYLLLFLLQSYAWVGMPTPQLQVEGRNLKDPHGNTVKLHGFAQTYSPWFNERGKYWNNYDVNTCLSYNKGLIDKILDAGWEMNFIRLHMDPYWSNTPGIPTTGENDISAFSYSRFTYYLDKVFIPMAEYAASKGLYVIMRPPGVCPHQIAVGDAYNQYLLKVWGYVSTHPKLRNNPAIMYELANEPINILGTDGTYGAGTQGHFDNLKTFFQSVVDTIRANGSQNILWIPGLGYQSLYKGYAINPIEGDNIGYAVHIYPGWFGSGSGYENFQKGWDNDVKPVANIAPICVTEMDWAPAKYNSSWGKDSTGIAGGMGFGANFKKITDASENVSWLLFTWPDLLAQYTGIPPAEGDTCTFLNDPQACPLPCFNWYKEYAKSNFPRAEYSYQSHSDKGDGTFANPVIFGDFPDPDVIRVGDLYYMLSTTMHHFPGGTILKSFDLVNWSYCSNPIDKIESNSCYNLDGCNVYSHGQWASSLKYKNGTFYLLFNTLDEGAYLMTAKDPAGIWTKKKLNTSYYDCGLLFEGDKTFVVYGINNLRIAELDSSFNKIPGSDKEVFQYTYRSGLEGSHLYKINGYYFIYSTYGGFPAFQVALRSTNIYGPYEEKIVISDDNIHQGALIETQTGEWWTMLFYDKGAYGRLPNLQPVSWIDNWPMVGVNGKGVTSYAKPNVGKVYPVSSLPTNDNFCDYKLAPQWEWNHLPDNSKWSLIEKAGSLRLHTANVCDSLIRAKNSLTQRILGYPNQELESYGTIKLNVNHMQEGDVSGLAVFQDPYAWIGIKMSGSQKQIYQLAAGKEVPGPVITDSIIYLRAVTNFNSSKAKFYYSPDNQSYTQLGLDFDMKYKLSIFVGNRFMIFNFATQDLGGYIDIDWFSTEKNFEESTFFDGSFTGYTKDALAVSSITTESTDLKLLNGSARSFTLTATYQDGHQEDITSNASYSVDKPWIAEVKNGQILSKGIGEASITASFQGVVGELKTIQIHVNSTYFPLTNELFNPSIYAAGTFDENTGTLHTGQWGFGGWKYSSGIDLTNYKYLVVKLKNTNTCGASFRLFDEDNYWTECAQYDFGSKRQLNISLKDMVRFGTTTKLDPSHLYIIGIWSFGSCDLIIDDIYVTNNDDFTKPTATNDIVYQIDENKPVDVYDLTGRKIRSQMFYKNIFRELPSGIYLAGGRKLAIFN